MDILMPRVAYSPSFDSLITGTFRENTATKLPDPVVFLDYAVALSGWQRLVSILH
jgi:hypothetical protein